MRRQERRERIVVKIAMVSEYASPLALPGTRRLRQLAADPVVAERAGLRC